MFMFKDKEQDENQIKVLKQPHSIISMERKFKKIG